MGKRRSFPAGYAPFAGTAYWGLCRDHVIYLDEFISRNRRFVEFFRHVSIPDELFVQTVLMNSPVANRVVNESLHYIDWSGGGIHPRTLAEADLEALRQSPKLFARKLDLVTAPGLLTRIDDELLSRHGAAGRSA